MRMIGVGLEELGVEEFVEGKFFDGGKMPISLWEYTYIQFIFCLNEQAIDRHVCFAEQHLIFGALFFPELYIDNKKESFKALGFKRYVLPQTLSIILY